MLDVDQDKAVHQLRRQISILLKARRCRTANAMQIQSNFFWQQDKMSQAKQSEMSFMWLGFEEIPNFAISLRHVQVGQWLGHFVDSVRSEETGLLNVEIGSKVIGVKYCLQTNPDSIYSGTPDVFRYGDKRALEVTLYLFRKNYITEEV
ncbi:hypothetical protein TNCV_29701 [Trichonephila clavipes]|nr:hypothetical protein TNCV_29701 [Trichonephila clavipes]